jgi:hypothetical protein
MVNRVGRPLVGVVRCLFLAANQDWLFVHHFGMCISRSTINVGEENQLHKAAF